MKEVRGWGGGGIAGATFCHPVGKKLRMCKVAKLPSRALQYATKEQVGEKKRSLAVALRGGSGQGTRLLSSGFD